MKKCLCVLLILALSLIGAPSLASEGTGQMIAVIDGQTITMPYDPTPQYSDYQQGSYGVSFYTYDSEMTVYEVFLVIPDTVTSGSVLSTAAGIQSSTVDCGVIYYRTDANMSETQKMACWSEDNTVPPGSSFEMTFASVTVTSESCEMSGSFEAVLTMTDGSAAETLSGEFTFRMVFDSDNCPGGLPGSSSAQVPETSETQLPDASDTPAPEQAIPTPAPFSFEAPAPTDTIHKI